MTPIRAFKILALHMISLPYYHGLSQECLLPAEDTPLAMTFSAPIAHLPLRVVHAGAVNANHVLHSAAAASLQHLACSPWSCLAWQLILWLPVGLHQQEA